MPDPPLNSQIHAYAEAFEQARQRVIRVFEGMDEDRVNLRPAPGSWSVAECIDHLCAHGSLMLPGLAAGIQRAKAGGRRGDGPFRYGSIARWFIRKVGPLGKDGRGKMKAPKALIPTSSHKKQELLERFVRLQDELIELIHRANGWDVARIRVPSVIIRLLRLPLGAWFEAIAAHQFRHIEQAESAKAELMKRNG